MPNWPCWSTEQTPHCTSEVGGVTTVMTASPGTVKVWVTIVFDTIIRLCNADAVTVIV